MDDGSPDNCGQICEEYAKRDSRIVVYHKENGGSPDARNYGIEHSHGEFLTFVDSDDVIKPDFVETLLGLIHKYDADIATARFASFSNYADWGGGLNFFIVSRAGRRFAHADHIKSHTSMLYFTDTTKTRRTQSQWRAPAAMNW